MQEIQWIGNESDNRPVKVSTLSNNAKMQKIENTRFEKYQTKKFPAKFLRSSVLNNPKIFVPGELKWNLTTGNETEKDRGYKK